MNRYESPSKFFEIVRASTAIKTIEGRLGKAGTAKVTRYKTEAAAIAAWRELVTAKTKSRYEPVPRKPVAATRTFELADKRWEIAIDGCVVTAGKPTTHATPAEALAAYNAAIGKKLAAGFRERVARNPALEEAIDADPYDADAYGVLADWLQGQGDPRGELIALQAAGKWIPGLELIAEHAASFLGPLAEHARCYDHLYHAPAPDAFAWKFGFIHGARMSYNQYWDSEFKGDIAQVLELLLRHPSGRFLAELVLMYNDDPADDDLQPLIDVLVKRAPEALRKLVIGDDVDQISWYRVGKLGKLWRALPRLEVLEIEAGQFELGMIDARALRRMILKTGGLSKANGKAIASASLPAIEHLEVYYGDPEYGGECTLAEAEHLLATGGRPKLRRLGLMNAEFADAICAALPGSKILPQLAHLDLSRGLMSDEGARTIAKHRAAFAHLDVLDVSSNYLTADGIEALKGVAKQVIIGNHKTVEADMPDFRYVDVGE